jgi:hypothetical protein
VLQTLAKQARNELVPPREWVPELRQEIEQAILRALNPDPAQRPASVLEFVKSLRPRLPAQGPTGRAAALPPSSAPGLAGEDPPSERRRMARHPYVMAIACAVQNSVHEKCDEPDSWPATVQDVARGGISLFLGRRLEPGTVLAVELHHGEAGAACALDARVVYVRAHGPGCWQIGCAFARPLTDEEFQNLM